MTAREEDERHEPVRCGEPGAVFATVILMGLNLRDDVGVEGSGGLNDLRLPCQVRADGAGEGVLV